MPSPWQHLADTLTVYITVILSLDGLNWAIVALSVCMWDEYTCIMTLTLYKYTCMYA